jgi:hypothetical protein
LLDRVCFFYRDIIRQLSFVNSPLLLMTDD